MLKKNKSKIIVILKSILKHRKNPSQCQQLTNLELGMLDHRLCNCVTHEEFEWQASYGTEQEARVMVGRIEEAVELALGTRQHPSQVVVLVEVEDVSDAFGCECADDLVVDVHQLHRQLMLGLCRVRCRDEDERFTSNEDELMAASNDAEQRIPRLSHVKEVHNERLEDSHQSRLLILITIPTTTTSQSTMAAVCLFK